MLIIAVNFRKSESLNPNIMKITLSLIICIIIIPVTGNTQIYTEDIKAKFASKSDIDFVLVSENNGSTSNCQYYVANDTLYEGSRKVALKDIRFDPIDIYKNVFNKINGSYPYVLTLKPKPNCFTFYYGTAVNGQIELYLPGETYALETWTWLYKAAQGVNTKSEPEADRESEAGAKDICLNTLTFLNDLMSTNLNAYLDDPISTDPEYMYYYSKINFPNSLKTYIIDTNQFSPDYRKAEIIFMEEWPDNNVISSAMIDKYRELGSILKICLDHNKFEYTNKDSNPDILYNYQSEYTKLQKPDPNVLFSSLQTQHGYIVQLVIIQNIKPNGGYENVLQMNLKAQ